VHSKITIQKTEKFSTILSIFELVSKMVFVIDESQA